MSKQPVLVVHGVANTNETEFNDRVAALSTSLGDRWDLVPVFWNQAGSDPRGIAASIPPFTLGSGVRSVRGTPSVSESVRAPGIEILNAPAVEAARSGKAAVRRIDAGGGGREVVVAAAARGLGRSTRPGVRARRSATDRDEVAQAIKETWPDLSNLPQLRDERILEQVGLLVADAVKAAQAGGGTTATRRGIDVGNLVRDLVSGVLHGADDLTGAIIGVLGEAVNSKVRTTIIPAFAKGAGDVLVYQAHRADIGAIVRQKLLEHGGIGTKERPAMVIGHSLGGIIAFDLAVGADPVYWSALVTFGSQSSILHVLDPRSSTLAKFNPDPYTAVKLPATIRKWTNIFEPWDPLAFFASKVFDGQSRKRIVDIEIPHLADSGLWTHSVYWTHDDAITAIGNALAEATPVE